MLPLLLTLHLTPPVLHARPPAAPKAQLAAFRPPSVRELLTLQLPPPVAVDASKGGTGHELKAGILTSLALSTAILGTGTALGLSLTCNREGKCDGPGAAIPIILALALLQPLVVPPIIAAMENAFAEPPLAGSLGKAVALAFMGEAAAGVLGVLALVIDWRVALAVFYVGQIVAVPALASLGLHTGGNALGPDELRPAAPAVLSPEAPAPFPNAPPPPAERPSAPPLPPTALNFSFAF